MFMTNRSALMTPPLMPPWTASVHFPDSYPIDVFHLSFNFLCLLLLYCIYLNGRVCRGELSNFVGSESGQKHGVKLLQNIVYNTIQTPPPHTVPYSIYCTYILGRGGGQRDGRGATVHKHSSVVHGGNSSQAGSKIPTMSECISSL